jgi:hypothetical protein
MDEIKITISVPDCNDEIREHIQERINAEIDHIIASVNRRYGTKAERRSNH